eukprot:scaffold121_cov412-Prasinococcus_capsulatus_cf.AAC.7
MENSPVAVGLQPTESEENAFPHGTENSTGPKNFEGTSSNGNDAQAQYNSDLALARALQQQEQIHAFVYQHGYHAAAAQGTTEPSTAVDGADEEGEEDEEQEDDFALARRLQMEEDRLTYARLAGYPVGGDEQGHTETVDDDSDNEEYAEFMEDPVDNMSYEELLSLQETVGNQSRAAAASVVDGLEVGKYSGHNCQAEDMDNLEQ